MPLFLPASLHDMYSVLWACWLLLLLSPETARISATPSVPGSGQCCSWAAHANTKAGQPTTSRWSSLSAAKVACMAQRATCGAVLESTQLGSLNNQPRYAITTTASGLFSAGWVSHFWQCGTLYTTAWQLQYEVPCVHLLISLSLRVDMLDQPTLRQGNCSHNPCGNRTCVLELSSSVGVFYSPPTCHTVACMDRELASVFVPYVCLSPPLSVTALSSPSVVSLFGCSQIVGK